MSFQAMAWAVKIRLPVKEKVTLLMLANYASNDIGDCYPSLNTLAEDTGLSKDSVIRAIKALEDGALLSVMRRQVEGVNLPNFYRLNLSAPGLREQGVVADSGEGSRTQQGGVVAGCDSNLSLEPISDPEKTIALPAAAQPATRSRFSDFWAAYPRKENRKKAEEVWKRKRLDEIADTIIADVKDRSLKHKQWLDGFIPHPTTYLNGERWTDEIREVSLGGRSLATTNGMPAMPQSKTGQAIAQLEEMRRGLFQSQEETTYGT